MSSVILEEEAQQLEAKDQFEQYIALFEPSDINGSANDNRETGLPRCIGCDEYLTPEWIEEKEGFYFRGCVRAVSREGSMPVHFRCFNSIEALRINKKLI